MKNNLSNIKKAKIILDDKNLATFKTNALARAKEFDVTNILPLYEELYESLVKEKVN